ncbi:MAG: hypothetical protein GY722_09495 [bacterium]|nr:hypothetical protein [bacterium]
MLHRVIRLAAADRDDVTSLLDDIEGQVTLIFDVDGTVVRQGASSNEVADAVNAAIDDFESHPSVGRAIALTNGADRGAPRMISRGNKPWTTRRRLGIGRTDRVVVVGDQVLTDGVLAWRLGATFVQLVVDPSNEPTAQSRLRKRGRWIEPFLFRKAPT